VLEEEDRGGGVIPAGAPTILTIRFAPKATGKRTASLVLNSDAPGGPHVVELHGDGAPVPAPHLIVEPATIELGSTLVGKTATVTVKLRNIGEAELQLREEPTIEGDNGKDFGIVGRPLKDKPIQPGASLGVTLTFTPPLSGPRSAMLLLATNADPPLTRVKLTGTGVGPDPPGLVGSFTATAENSLVELSWGAAERAKQYKLYRVVEPTDKEDEIAQLSRTSYTDTGLTNGTTYTYFVIPFNESGPGPASARINATPHVLVGVDVKPSAVRFPDIQVGRSATDAQVHIRNHGPGNIWLYDGDIEYVGDMNDFDNLGLGRANVERRSGDNLQLRVVPPGEYCFVQLNFVPKSVGAKSVLVSIGYDTGPGSKRQYADFTYTGNATQP
jgi:hypothetical protein